MKKTNKRTKKGAIIALCMAGAIAISGAFAFLSDSDSAINRFKFTDEDGEQTVDVRIDEPSWNEDNGDKILPLDTVAKDPQVVNEGENDVYSFVTVLVPTAKQIKLNNDDGSTYTLNDVELFRYTVNDGWKEISKTDKDTLDAHQVSAAKGDTRQLVLGTSDSITNKANSNVYFTAHTYAYAGEKMTKLAAGETTNPVFDSVTMINIADGARVPKTLENVLAGLTADEGTTLSIVDDTIVATKGDTSKVIYKTVMDGDTAWVVDLNGNKQYKAMSQFVAEDNINIYVDTYAIQANNITDDVEACWTICANTNAGVAEGASYTNDFFFRTVANDIGSKSAVKGA
mgnify:CR=1 FL=1|jgi:hypothetical protein